MSSLRVARALGDDTHMTGGGGGPGALESQVGSSPLRAAAIRSCSACSPAAVAETAWGTNSS